MGEVFDAFFVGHQLVHDDVLAKKGQRVWAESKLGNITDTGYSNSDEIVTCKITYDDGTTCTENYYGFLQFAKSPRHPDRPTIPVWAVTEIKKSMEAPKPVANRAATEITDRENPATKELDSEN